MEIDLDKLADSIDMPSHYYLENYDEWASKIQLQAARAYLEEKRNGGWLPIETAPKDGTRIILLKNGYKPVFGWFDDGEWINDILYIHYSNGTPREECNYEPDYWQPIITPPTETGE